METGPAHSPALHRASLVVPTEVPRMICDHLVPDPFDYRNEFIKCKSALVSLCRVNKQYCGVAQHILHRTYFKPLSAPEYDSTGSQNSSPRLRLFLRTLLQRPDLAARVQNVALGTWWYDCEDWKHPWTPPSHDMLKMTKDAVADMGWGRW